jgi:quinol monooxygenase YgiN
MITVIGTLRLNPQLLDRARPAMAAMVAASRAEPGCIRYALDLLDPAVLHIVEQWQDRAALAAHFATPHLAEWRAQFAVLGLHDRQLEMVEGDPEPT